MKKSVFLLAATLPFLALGQSANQPADPQDSSRTTSANEAPPMLGIAWAKGFNPNARASEAAARRPAGANMLYHGGKILPTANIEAIFWGTSWPSSTSDKIRGIDTWYTGFSGSRYAATSDEWTGTNGQVGAFTSYAGHVLDTAQATASDPQTVLNQVCASIASPDPSGNGYYPFIATCLEALLDSADITAPALAAAGLFNLLSSSTWMAILAAILAILQGSTLRDWRRLPT